LKIQGKNNVQLIMEGKLKQPYPLSEVIITVKGKTVDLAVAVSETHYHIDGKNYSGLLMYLLNEDKQ
jgi:hypothetical protein